LVFLGFSLDLKINQRCIADEEWADHLKDSKSKPSCMRTMNDAMQHIQISSKIKHSYQLNDIIK